jgi:hypothetical protein
LNLWQRFSQSSLLDPLVMIFSKQLSQISGKAEQKKVRQTTGDCCTIVNNIKNLQQPYFIYCFTLNALVTHFIA